jgi:hypothetical protein
MHLTPLLLGLLIAAPNLSGSLLRIPFSAWVPLPLKGIAFLLRTLTPLTILGLALLAGYAGVRRADSKSVFAFIVPFIVVDALLTIAIYGPSIVPQG